MQDIVNATAAVAARSSPPRRGFTPLPGDEPDTDPLVTRPLHQQTLPAIAAPPPFVPAPIVVPGLKDPIPPSSLAHGILLAAEAYQRRLSRFAGGRTPHMPEGRPLDGSPEEAVLAVVRAAGRVGIRRPAMLTAVRALAPDSASAWSDALLRHAARRLEAAGLIRDNPVGYKNQRFYVAVER